MTKSTIDKIRRSLSRPIDYYDWHLRLHVFVLVVNGRPLVHSSLWRAKRDAQRIHKWHNTDETLQWVEPFGVSTGRLCAVWMSRQPWRKGDETQPSIFYEIHKTQFLTMRVAHLIAAVIGIGLALVAGGVQLL